MARATKRAKEKIVLRQRRGGKFVLLHNALRGMLA
jgi:hypothetical protein